MSSENSKIIGEGLTYDDVLLVPDYSDVLPSQVNVSSQFSRNIRLNIPIVAVVDTNSDPIGINYPIPGNDDASRAISLYCDLVSKTILDGMESQLGSAGIDLGEAQTPLSEDLPEEKVLEQEVSDKSIPEDKKEADEPKLHSSEAKAEHTSSDGAEDISKVGGSEKAQDKVKANVSSETETDKGK